MKPKKYVTSLSRLLLLNLIIFTCVLASIITTVFIAPHERAKIQCFVSHRETNVRPEIAPQTYSDFKTQIPYGDNTRGILYKSSKPNKEGLYIFWIGYSPSKKGKIALKTYLASQGERNYKVCQKPLYLFDPYEYDEKDVELDEKLNSVEE